MEKWLLKKGAVSITDKTKKERWYWYKKVSELPPCLKPDEIAENSLKYEANKQNGTD